MSREERDVIDAALGWDYARIEHEKHRHDWDPSEYSRYESQWRQEFWRRVQTLRKKIGTRLPERLNRILGAARIRRAP